MYSVAYIYCTFTRPASTIAIGSVSVTRQEQRPDIAAGGAQIRADMAEDDRRYAQGLTAIAEPPASSSASPTATNPSSLLIRGSGFKSLAAHP
jgi:hypothetical protein